MPLSVAKQDALTEKNKGKLCDRCHEKERYLYLMWCSDCLYSFAIGEDILLDKDSSSSETSQ